MSRGSAFVLLLLHAAFSAAAQEKPSEKSVVFVAHDNASIAEFHTDSAAVTRMVNALVLNLTGKRETSEAWRSLVRPVDRVGIKISAVGGRYFSTHRAVVDAIVSGLLTAGVDPKNVLVWDRGDMIGAGYAKAPYQVRAIEPVYGYDPKQVFSAPLLGKLIWGDVRFAGKREALVRDGAEQISSESHLARLLGTVTRIINVPVMSAHEGCGVAGALYNLTVPNVDNWRRFTVPAGADYLAELLADERIKPKVVLHLMDGLVAQYAGGPEFQPNYAFQHGTLYASKDPVALDANAIREIDAWRTQAQLPAITPRAGYVQTAGALGLGKADPAQIELRSVR